MVNGILAVDKPSGLTSHDVVARVRRLTGLRRVGHAGTLDPMATGVLVLCLGEATRLSGYLMDGIKWYLARISFGTRTDTDDALGKAIATSLACFDELQLHEALKAQVGQIAQIPPAFSAIKSDGVAAYKRARAGQVVEQAPRQVTIYALTLLAFRPNPAMADVLVCCSKGTYIRSLARDVGDALGCGAHLAGLRRLASGSFTVDQCIPLADLEAAVSSGGAGAVAALLSPPDVAVSTWRCAIVGDRLAAMVHSGVSVPAASLVPGEPIRIYDSSGQLLALATAESSANGVPVAHPHTVFSPMGIHT